MPIDKVLSTSIADGAVTASAISNTANLSISSLSTSSNTVTIGTAAYFVGSGSVGIGTSSPDARLQVQGAASTQLILRDTSAYSAGVNGGGILFQGLDSASNNRSLSSIQGIGDGSNSGGLTLSSRSAGSLIERMRIDSSGIVLVNATASHGSERLLINGGSNSAGDGYLTLRRGGNATNGDGIGIINFADTRASSVYARIQAIADSTPGTNDFPGALVFYTTADGAASTTERMRITSAGNVGIGASYSISSKLVIDLDNGGSKYLNLINSAGTIALQAYGTFGTAHLRMTYPAVADWDLLAGSSGQLAFLSNSSERMRIDSSGNVGIGTTSPASKLHISGGTTNTARIDGSTRGGAWLVMRDGSVTGGIYNTGAILGDTTSGVGIFAETGYDVRFYTNGSATERMRINSSGNVGIGTTSPSTKLHVAGIINSQSIYTGSYTQDMYGSTNLPIDLGQNESTGMIVILSSSLGCTGFGAVVSVIGHYTRGEASLNIIHNNARYGTMSYSIDSSQNFAVFLRVNAASLGWGCGGVKPSTATVFYTIINGSSKYSTGF